MTFDEAIEHFRNNTDISGTAVFLDDVEDTLKELREEYAPTVEMTKEQYQQFIDFRKRTDSVQTHAVTLHDKKTKYPEFLNDLVGGVYGRLFLQAWLHPETIKIVDEQLKEQARDKMKVIEKQVYIVGFRKTDNDEWETSGATYGNQIDAQAVMNKLSKETPQQLKLFKFVRAIPL